MFVSVEGFFTQGDNVALAELLQTSLDEAAAAGDFLFFGWWEEDEGFEDEEQFPEGIACVVDGVDTLVVGVEGR